MATLCPARLRFHSSAALLLGGVLQDYGLIPLHLPVARHRLRYRSVSLPKLIRFLGFDHLSQAVAKPQRS